MELNVKYIKMLKLIEDHLYSCLYAFALFFIAIGICAANKVIWPFFIVIGIGTLIYMVGKKTVEDD